MSPLGSLSTFPPGSRVRVESLCDCPRARGRQRHAVEAIADQLGITPGTVVEITSCCGGPVCLRARGCSITLGNGLAQKVFGRLEQGAFAAA